MSRIFARAFGIRGRVLRSWPCMLVLLLCTSCGHREPLRIGLDTWPGYEYLFLAQQEGFFEQEGVEVKLIQCPTLADSRRAFERAQLDVMAGTLIELLLVREHSDRFPQVFLVTDFSNGADNILAASDIHSPAELEGKRLGLVLGCLDVYLATRMMQCANLSLDDLTLVPMEPAAFEEAIVNGQIDAVVGYPSIQPSLVEKHGYHPIFSTAEIPREVVDVLMVDRAVATTRSKDLAAVCRAYSRAQEYAAAHPEEAAALFAQREGISPDEYVSALDSGIRLVTAEEQSSFFGPKGALRSVIPAIHQSLRSTGQVDRSIDLEDCILSARPPRAGF